ncbi:hypothetical protein DFS34DRAFT_94917 [Phlyctochytrium arcticum]|nr:hypothetical protein DFS34DRAFT_94917 [Phlyctochytrium arcticum]
MNADLRLSLWKWDRLVGSRKNWAHLLLPLFQYLSEYEYEHRPHQIPGGPRIRRTLHHVKLSPERTDRGPENGYAQFDYYALCQILGRWMGNNPLQVMHPGATVPENLSRDGNNLPNDPVARNNVISQLFRFGKIKSLRNGIQHWTFRNRGQDLPIRKVSIITNGDNTMLTFEVQAPPNFHRRIPTVADLKDYSHPAHREFRRVENPDQAGGALHALNRRPIMTAARALNMTTPGAATPSAHIPNAVVPLIRPIIGIDFGQRFQAVAVYDNLSSAAVRTHSLAQAQPHQIGIIKQMSRHSRRQQIRRVRGRQYREIDKSAWFERKHACRVAQSEELQALMQLLEEEKTHFAEPESPEQPTISTSSTSNWTKSEPIFTPNFTTDLR